MVSFIQKVKNIAREVLSTTKATAKVLEETAAAAGATAASVAAFF